MNAFTPLAGAYLLNSNLSALMMPAASCFGLADAAIGRLSPYPWSNAAGLKALAGHLHRSCKAYPDPGFGIDWVVTSHDGKVPVSEVDLSGGDSWMRLTHFSKPDGLEQPALLILAPNSGHNASLLRETVRGILRDHDTAILGFADAADIHVRHGHLGVDAMVNRIIRAIDLFAIHPDGSGSRRPIHVLAVCQPAPLALVAAAILEKAGKPLASLTLMGGPIDPAANHTDVTRFALSRDLSWFEAGMITPVSGFRSGAGRRVYPGFLQLAAFMAMNPERHLASWHNRFLDELRADGDKVARHDRFYDDYLSVIDLPAEFYLETLERVFRRRLLALNAWHHEGNLIDVATICRTPLATIEGAEDDICAPGQTAAAHALCHRIPAGLRLQHVQTGVGHYGLFSGRKWQQEILPLLNQFIRGAS